MYKKLFRLFDEKQTLQLVFNNCLGIYTGLEINFFVREPAGD